MNVLILKTESLDDHVAFTKVVTQVIDAVCDAGMADGDVILSGFGDKAGNTDGVIDKMNEVLAIIDSNHAQMEAERGDNVVSFPGTNTLQ